MKKIYAIFDNRAKEFVTDVFCADNDRQANVALSSFVESSNKMHIDTRDLLLYCIGKFEFDSLNTPIKLLDDVLEVPTIIIGDDNNE